MNVYFQVGKLLDTIAEKKLSFKEAFYSNNYHLSQFKKRIYSLGLNTLKHNDELEMLLSELLSEIEIKSKNMFKVCLFDYFTSDNKPKIKGGILKLIKSNEDKLQAMIEKRNFLQVRKPSKAITFHDFSKELSQYKLHPFIPTLRLANSMTEEVIQLAENGKILIQSVASSLPVHYLKTTYGKMLPKTFKALDSCSAPGNKTIQMAQYFKKANIIAVEKNAKRCESLKNRLKLFNLMGKVKVVNNDALDLSDEELKNPRIVLLDPSCSGSGMEGYSSEDVCSCDGPRGDRESLAKYTTLQFDLIKKFMGINSVSIISYSTCSIFREENEDMIERVMEGETKWKLGEIVMNDFACGKLMENTVRVCRKCHETDGFFLCFFERIEQME